MHWHTQQQHTGKQGWLRKVASAVVLAGVLALSTVAQAADRRVAIYNTSDYTMQVYASPINADSYYYAAGAGGGVCARKSGEVRALVGTHAIFEVDNTLCDGKTLTIKIRTVDRSFSLIGSHLQFSQELEGVTRQFMPSRWIYQNNLSVGVLQLVPGSELLTRVSLNDGVPFSFRRPFTVWYNAGFEYVRVADFVVTRSPR